MTYQPSREQYTAGLRELADLLDQHPEVPLPHQGAGGDTRSLSIYLLGVETDLATRYATALSAFGAKPEAGEVREGNGPYDIGTYSVPVQLGGLYVRLTARLDAVAEARATGPLVRSVEWVYVGPRP